MTIPFENLGTDVLLLDGDFQVSPTGDLMITQDGRTCLLQDCQSLLETLPGDLFYHPGYGAGIPRLYGEEDRANFEALVVRAIKDAFTYDEGVGPRIEENSLVVYAVTPKIQREASFQISIIPLDEEWTNRLNWVYNMGWPEGEVF